MWSWPNASFPAISRYFINTYDGNITTYGRWRYSFDLLHFSLDGGEFLTQNIAGPFLVEQILNHPSTSEQDEDEPRFFDAHFTPRVPLKLSVASYTSWGLHENTLVNITTPPPGWSLNSLHHHHNTKEGNWVFEQARHRKEIPDNIHTCYASSSPHLLHSSPSPAEFFFATPASSAADKGSSCSSSLSGFCGLSVSSLHSWNQSYVGNISCSLYSIGLSILPTSTVRVQHESHLAEVFIHGSINEQGAPIPHTAPVSVPVYNKLEDNRRYILRCHKLDDLYSCIDSVEISIEINV